MLDAASNNFKKHNFVFFCYVCIGFCHPVNNVNVRIFWLTEESARVFARNINNIQESKIRTRNNYSSTSSRPRVARCKLS